MLKYSKSKSLFHYSQMFMQLRKESTDIQTDANYSKQKKYTTLFRQIVRAKYPKLKSLLELEFRNENEILGTNDPD